MKYTSKEKVFMQLKGIIAGCFWEFGLTILKIPIFLFEKIYIVVIYMLIILTIYFFILKSNSKQKAFISWLYSIPAAIIVILIYAFSPLYNWINDFAFQNHLVEGEFPFPFLYDYNSSLIYISYLVFTFITAILAIIFSIVTEKNKQRTHIT